MSPDKPTQHDAKQHPGRWSRQLLQRATSLVALLSAFYFFDYALFDVSEWRLQQSDYVTELLKKWQDLVNHPNKLVQLALCLMLFVIGVKGFILPTIKSVVQNTPGVIGHFSTTYYSQIQKIQSWFSTGADVIEKGSMWLLLVSLIFYLFNDRESSAITTAWETIERAQGKWGDLGRREALSTLIDYDVSLIGIDLSYASLSGLTFDDEHDNYDVDPDRPFLDLVSLSHSDISFASFPCVFMRQADLQHAVLSGTRFTGADLRDTLFTGSDFGGSPIEAQHYMITDFSFADLRGANLSDLPVSATHPPSPYIKYLSSIQPQGAWLLGADLRGAVVGMKVLGLSEPATPTQLNFALENLKTFALWDQHTVFPTIIRNQLTYWQSQEETLEAKKRRWQHLVALYQASFGEERAKRLLSYVELSSNNLPQLNRQFDSISDFACRRLDDDF